MNSLENFYIPIFLRLNTIISEQSQKDENRLFDKICNSIKHAYDTFSLSPILCSFSVD